jgi:penicillin-binding protein 2
MPDTVHRTLVEGLMGVVNSVYGTANSAFAGFPTNNFPLAAKTGTAQTAKKEPWKDTSLFAAFGPVDHPQYVVVAVLEEAGFGARAAAPTVRQVFEVLAGVTAKPDVQEAPPLGQVQERPSVFAGDITVDPGSGAYD